MSKKKKITLFSLIGIVIVMIIAIAIIVRKGQQTAANIADANTKTELNAKNSKTKSKAASKQSSSSKSESSSTETTSQTSNSSSTKESTTVSSSQAVVAKPTPTIKQVTINMLDRQQLPTQTSYFVVSTDPAQLGFTKISTSSPVTSAVVNDKNGNPISYTQTTTVNWKLSSATNLTSAASNRQRLFTSKIYTNKAEASALQERLFSEGQYFWSYLYGIPVAVTLKTVSGGYQVLIEVGTDD